MLILNILFGIDDLVPNFGPTIGIWSWELRTNGIFQYISIVLTLRERHFNDLSANLTKWSNALKQFLGNLPTTCLNVFDHFVNLTFKRLKLKYTLLLFIRLETKIAVKSRRTVKKPLKIIIEWLEYFIDHVSRFHSRTFASLLRLTSFLSNTFILKCL